MLTLSTEQEVANPGFALSEDCGEVRGQQDFWDLVELERQNRDWRVFRYTSFFLQDIFQVLILQETGV